MTIRGPAIEKKAEVNFRQWLRTEEAQRRLAKRDILSNVGPYIAWARESGAGGSELARKVARRSGWDVLDREIIDYMDEHYGTPRCLIQHADEKHENWFSQNRSATRRLYQRAVPSKCGGSASARYGS